MASRSQATVRSQHRAGARPTKGYLSSSAAATAPPASLEPQGTDARVQRGAYLVGAMSCHDCHTPWVIGPRGPEPDMSPRWGASPRAVTVPSGTTDDEA